ncbi:MAG: transketolase [Chloroflexi bacterium]|nr:transketolase [Chloroflexota bacterium]
MDTDQLTAMARTVRNHVLEMVAGARKGHIGGAFSATDILVSLYFGGILRVDPKNPSWGDRDRFILSKGHSCVALYAILAERGFFPASELDSFCQNGSRLGGHPDRRIPGVEADTGSLGHGLGIGAGLALSARIGRQNYKTVVLLGDGECYEGSVWEAAMFAGHHQLSNLVAIVDRNCQCVTDFTEDCNRLEPFADKWRAFNWDVREVDGHSFEQLVGAFKDFGSRGSGKPLSIIANTVKGKGVTFMERTLVWHHSVPSSKNLEEARRQLSREGAGR